MAKHRGGQVEVYSVYVHEPEDQQAIAAAYDRYAKQEERAGRTPSQSAWLLSLILLALEVSQ